MSTSRAWGRRHHSIVAIVSVCALLAIAAIVSTPAALAVEPGATLSGTVRGAAGEDLSSGSLVVVYQDGTAVASSTSSAGKYVVSGLGPGEYDVLVSYCCTSTSPYIGEWGDGSHGAAQHQPTVIAGGANTLDFTLDAGGFIKGTFSGSGAPMNSIFTLIALDPVLPGPATSVRAVLGEISSPPLPPGRYGIIADAGAQWIAEDHNGVKTSTPTEPALVVEMGKTTTVHIDLEPAGEISGTVYLDNRDGTRSPVAGASVMIENIDTRATASAHAGPDGKYALRGVSGRYRVAFEMTSSSDTVPEYYGGARTAADAEIVTVRDNAVVSGIDASLDLGGRIDFSIWYQPAPGREYTSDNGYTLPWILIQRRDERSGQYTNVPYSTSGPLEPGIYSVRAATTHWIGDPQDVATPAPHFIGERKGIVVRAGEITDIGHLLLETDYYDPIYPPVESAPASAAGSFVSVAPARLLDTRVGTGASRATVGANQSVELQVTGRGGVPAAGVAAVAMNVTVTGPSASGFTTAYPTGTTSPTASNLNFSAGQTVPNLVTVKIGVDGKVTLTNNSSGTVHLIADVAGYYLSGIPSAPGTFGSLRPARLMDTRDGIGAGHVGANETVLLQVTGRGGVPWSDVSAVVMNVTVTGPSAGGFVTAYPAGTTQPTASNLNFSSGQTIPNLVTVKVGADGKVALTNNSAGAVHMIADVAGYYLGGSPSTEGAFVSVDPARLLDTRVGTGEARALGANQSIDLQVTGRGGVPASGVAGVTMNVTVTGPSANGFITAYPAGTAQPTASNLNFTSGQTMPNLVTVKVGAGGRVTLTNNSSGTVDLIADVAGYSLSP